MKQVLRIVVLFALVPLLMVGCKGNKKADSAQESKFETLKSYLLVNSMDLTDMLDGWIITAGDVNGSLDTYYVMDIRSQEDYDAGHIIGAVHSSLATIVGDAAAVEKPIIVACYTGQKASHAVVALRLSGFANAKVLKFGMGGWNSDFIGSWSSNIADVADGHTNWTTSVEPPLKTFDYPSLTSAYTDGAAILKERVGVLTSGFNGVVNTTVLDNSGDYFINNYWPVADWSHYGHIAGAYRISPLSLNNINNYDASKQVVTYCYTGQTSSMITAYLKVLGYDALSLKFGANGMVHSVMEGHKWTSKTPGDFEYEISK